jgi:hypothetical protein
VYPYRIKKQETDMDSEFDRHGFPTAGFFVAFKRFTGPRFKPEGEWGDILDGPQVDYGIVIDAILEAWKDSAFAPDTDDLRVWQIVPGKPAEDCTVWAIQNVIETLEPTHERY